jgi:hypothetical protein
MKFMLVYCIIFVLLQQQCDALFTKLKQKLRNFVKGKLQPKFAEFPSETGLEYPDNNPKLLREIRKLWKKYYACLQKKYESLGPQKSLMPEVIMVFEGSSVR